MSSSETIVAVVSDAAEKSLWSPIFSKMKERITLMEVREVFHLTVRCREKRISPSVALLSTRLYPREHPKLVSQFRQLFPECEIVLMGLSTDPPPPLGVILRDNVRHMLINPADDPFRDLDREASLYDLTMRRLKNGLPLYISDYIKPGTAVREFRVVSSEQKEELIGELESAIPGSSREMEMLRMKAALLADEMLENALYAAPRGEGAAPLFQKGEKRTLSEGEDVSFRFGFDGESLALEVTDGWGTLSSEAFFEHVTRNLECLGIHEEIGGRGLFIIWRFLDSLHIRINPGRQTVIGGKIRLASADCYLESKGFHICAIP
jgi:hypothetical protein